MPSVAIPNEFFRRERNDIYSRWQLAFWRELVQNATDAGARTIAIALEAITAPDGARFTRVSFADNGHGMTRRVLEEVYFRLGATTKTDGATVGGFGRARILTCFSMRRYRIETGRLVAESNGALYNIAEEKGRAGRRPG